MRTLDRYVLREVLIPFILALLMLTFALEIPPIIEHGEELISKGASWVIVVKVLLTLVPQALGITIPMALLIGFLIALGRLAGDREIVAMEACGVSLARLLRPLLLLGVLATAATTYVMIVALPAANQAFREITFRLLMTSAESDVKPRVFYENFPNLVVYVQEVIPHVGWTDVLVADSSRPSDPQLYLAKKGRLVIDERKRTVQMVLENGTRHGVKLQQPDEYDIAKFEQSVIWVNPDSVFVRSGPLKGLNELTIAELRLAMADRRDKNIFPHNEIMAWQKKFSIPAACLAFTLVALGLGVSNRRDGRLASFVLGMAVVFVYWMIYLTAEAVTKSGSPPHWFAWIAMWIPNVVVGLWGALLIYRKLRAPERPIQISLPSFSRRKPSTIPASANEAAIARGGERVVVVIRIPHFRIPRPSILDWYVLQQALHVCLLAIATLLGLFYIATVIDLSDHLFRGRTTASTIVEYLWYATPQFAYYAIPLAVLIGALVTIGALTKNTELVVMRACGISLYRTAAPLMMLAAIGSIVLLGLEERILAYSNRRAETINDAIRGRAPRTSSLNRRWIAASNGDVYQYVYFDSARNELHGVSIYKFAKDRSTLTKRSYISSATFKGDRETKGEVAWLARSGWERQIVPEMRFVSFENRPYLIEGPGYFGSERPDANQMSYSQLSEHVASLQTSGFNVTPYLVALHRKLSFPFVTLIMALIAVPFAVTTGKRGAMYGIGAGIVLAILYWTAISVFAAIGSGGALAPALAAWAPNIIFGCAAIYLLLTVRT
jgi:LPS export ABC transporter permease LptG/LPS export ABC transporter permease LptF